MNIVDALVMYCRQGTDEFIRDNGHEDATRWIVIHPDTYYALVREWDPMRQATFGPPPMRRGSFLVNPLRIEQKWRLGIYEIIVSTKPEVTSGIPWPECLREERNGVTVAGVGTTAQGATT